MSMIGTGGNQTVTLDLTKFSENLRWNEASKYQPDRKLKSGGGPTATRSSADSTARTRWTV
ncbi:hypothetical protein ACGFYP_34185 [Streptomyces sp. NPDC048370]|uniref:hypothetical protein n=1 Tax=Streptomyces sp. NPDC048370 TaxID=3365540 RepID=UPI00371FC906